MQGFGPVDTSEDGEPFHADWQARVWALNVALIRQGSYTVDEFRDAIERMPPADYLNASYYQRWFAAVRTLVVEKGIVDGAQLGRVLAEAADA